MILTIWRHGEAGQATTDRRRQLTPNGREDVGCAAQCFRDTCQTKNLPSPDLIAHSPWDRTTQTAAIIGAVFSKAQILSQDDLVPSSTVLVAEQTVTRMAAESSIEHLLLVSHQPLVSLLLDAYVGETCAVPFLPPCGVATLSIETLALGCASVSFWSLPPHFEAAQ